jgi:hypothetical protein
VHANVLDTVSAKNCFPQLPAFETIRTRSSNVDKIQVHPGINLFGHTIVTFAGLEFHRDRSINAIV